MRKPSGRNLGRNATPLKPTKPAPKPVKRRAGAQSAKTSLRDKLHSWQLHHRDSGKDALRRMRAAPTSNLMTILVIAIALALPAGLSVLLENVSALTKGWDGNAHLSVFLNDNVNEKQQRELAEQWSKKVAIVRTEVISRAQALEEYKLLSGFGDVLDALPDNPLPPLIIVYPQDTTPEALEVLQRELQKESAVDVVQLDVEWVQRLHSMIELGTRIVSTLGIALAIAVVLVVVNTIRLAIESRREEIVVVKIVGGTDGFVRRPFLYTGFWIGLFGGITAVVLVNIALIWIDSPLDDLLALYNSDYSVAGFSAEAAFTLPIFAGLLGLTGAWVAVGRHLKDIEPQAF